MAAGEDEAQPVVLDRILGRARGIARLFGLQVFNCVVGGADPRHLAHRVDALEAGRGDEPGTRVLRHAVLRPLLDGRRKRLLHRLLRPVEIAEQADQRRKDAPRLLAPDFLDARPGGVRRAASQMRGSTGRTSIVPPTRSVGIRSASASASSTSRHSTMWKPPNCSLVSAYGPSVTTRRPPWTRSVFASPVQASFSVARCLPSRSTSATQAP